MSDPCFTKALYRADLLSQGDLEKFAQYIMPVICLARSEESEKEIMLNAIHEAMDQAEGDLAKFREYVKPLLLLMGVDSRGQKVVS